MSEFDLDDYEDVGEAVLSIVTRHPMREDELVSTLERWTDDDVHLILRNLSESGQAQVVTRNGVRFWTASGTKYAN
jgi:hypothetical protein